MTDEELREEYMKCLESPAYFYNNYCVVVDKTTGTTSKPNPITDNQTHNSIKKKNKMKITIDNIDNISYYASTKKNLNACRSLLAGLFTDLVSLNNKSKYKLYIDYKDEHTEYNPERTDPCPDFYGYFMLRLEGTPSETVGFYMTLDELELALFVLGDFVEQTTKIDNNA